MPFTTGAGFAATYGTAYVALVHRARLQPGETLLVFGAAGGVGLAAVEIGRRLGATVIAGASADAKLQVAGRHGAHHLVNYQSDDLVEQVRTLTSNRGADVVFDPIGGEVFDKALRCIAFEGRVMVIGFAGGRIPTASAGRVLIKGCGVIGSSWTFTLQHRPEIIRRAFEQMADWYVEGALRPEIFRTFRFEQVAEALSLVAQRAVSGKVILTK